MGFRGLWRVAKLRTIWTAVRQGAFVSAKVRVQRLRANEAGLSHFDSFEIEREMTAFAPPALPFPVFESIPALCFVLLRLPTGWIGERHPTPARQMLFCRKDSGRACRSLASKVLT